MDPLAPSYPWYTPYQFAGNKPINCIDLDGLEEHEMTNKGNLNLSRPWNLSFMWKNREDYNADFYEYFASQRSEVLAIGRYKYSSNSDDITGKLFKVNPQTTIVVTAERYYVAINDGNEYKPKEPRVRMMYSIFRRDGSMQTNLTLSQFLELEKIEGKFTMDSPFDFGVSRASKVAKTAQIVMMGGKKSTVGLLMKTITEASDFMKNLTKKYGENAAAIYDAEIKFRLATGEAGGNIHKLKGELKGYSAIDIPGTGGGRGGGRIIFKETDDDVIIKGFVEGHDYKNIISDIDKVE